MKSLTLLKLTVFIIWMTINDINGWPCDCECCIGPFCRVTPVGSIEVLNCTYCRPSLCQSRYPMQCVSSNGNEAAASFCRYNTSYTNSTNNTVPILQTNRQTISIIIIGIMATIYSIIKD